MWQEVRRLAEECEINRHDEALYVAATKLINSRILSKYPDAQRLLEQVREAVGRDSGRELEPEVVVWRAETEPSGDPQPDLVGG